MSIFNGGAGNDTFIGTAGVDTLLGNDGNDLLIGVSGFDTLMGGAGNDILLLIGSGGGLLDGGSGFDVAYFGQISSAVTVDLSIKGVQATGGAGNVILTGIEFVAGTSGNDILTGDKLDNGFAGAMGDDLINGGAGVDGVSYDISASASLGVTVNLGINGAQNTGSQGVDTLVSIENIRGSQAADVLTGTRAANILDGQKGADALTGGAGDDTLLGGSGKDTLWGGAGNDTLDGGVNVASDPSEERDTAIYSDATAAVTVDLTLAGAQNTGGAGTDTLISIEALIGSAFDDTLTGGVADHAALLEGGAGNDTLIGVGGGLVAASYMHAKAGVTVDLSIVGAQNTVGAGVDTLIGINSVVGTIKNDVLTGDANDNHFVGGPGADVINGGGGSDWVHYEVGDASLDPTLGVTVDLSITKGQNTVGAGRDTLVSIENIEGTQYTDVLTGNALDNTIAGAGGDDTLRGGAGDDVLLGGGADSMTGGTGADTFKILAYELDPSKHVLITDLADGEDIIDLSDIDANPSTGTDDAFQLVSAYDGSAGEITLSYDAGTNITTLAIYLNAYADHAHAADVTLQLSGDHHAFTGFVL